LTADNRTSSLYFNRRSVLMPSEVPAAGHAPARCVESR
jgi:hypothetical protein